MEFDDLEFNALFDALYEDDDFYTDDDDNSNEYEDKIEDVQYGLNVLHDMKTSF
jgi:hypothetical protein